MKELRTAIAKEALQQPYMGEEVPQVYLTLEKDLAETRKTAPIMDYTQLQNIALERHGIVEVSEV